MNKNIVIPALGFLKNEKLILQALCIGLTGSLIFWPLLSSILCILLFCYWLFFIPKQINPGKKRLGLVLLFSTLYLIVLAGLFFTYNMPEAIFKLQQKSPFLIFPIVFGFSTVLDPKIQKNILLSFILFTFLGCLTCIANGLFFFFKTGLLSRLYGYNMISLKLMSPFLMGLFCLIAIIILVDHLMFEAGKLRIKREIIFSLIIFFSIFLLLLGNRNILLSAILVAVYFYTRFTRNTISSLIFPITIFVGLIAAITINPSLRRQWHDLIDFSSENTIPLNQDKSLGRSWGGKAIRLAIWKSSLDIIKENWLTGVGTGDSQDALQQAYERKKFYFASRYNKYNAHNQYIQETITYGIPGLVIFLSCLTVPIILYFKDGKNRIYIAFLFCILTISITESIFELSKGVILYAFLNSLFAFNNKNVKVYD